MSNNTDKLIPIAYVRNITPLIFGDRILNIRVGNEFTLSDSLQISKFNSGLFENENNLGDVFYVISFADRPNTGERPVGDDVVVDYDVSVVGAEVPPLAAGWLCWNKNITTWKPNHAAMLRQCQAEQALQKLDEGDVIMVNSRDELTDAVIAKAKGKPVYTQAMKDAGELPQVGSEVGYNTASRGDVIGVVTGYRTRKSRNTLADNCDYRVFVKFEHNERLLKEVKPIDTRNDEQKLRDTINEMWDAAPDKWAIIEDIINSDKFTITLNK